MLKSLLVSSLLLSTAASTESKGIHYVVLTWKASTTPRVTYRVYKSRRSGGPFYLIKKGLLRPRFTDHAVLPGVTYNYVVTAFNGKESRHSNEARAKIP
jgi:hypothetical protein